MKDMEKNKDSSMSAAPLDTSNMYKWQAIIIGPKDTPYDGGVFKLDISFSPDYPFKPPRIEFITKIFHCNVHGKHLCLDILKSQWSPALTIDKVLLSITSLMNEPNPSDPLNRDAAEKYMESKEEYNMIAREWTQKYATEDASTNGRNIN
ncbi:Ubiquitin-conjugating enzyme E2 [Enterospora canceri]|uniref:Ubiquitin-conjugating enzyme E2 n=1 Tax=Enterospora canceri TaxID=1081671 RepID=A0A1Y1SA62_9MICR|nr:Ubiquitin-conjugating enzyme E2 [Enterospora canceri]